MLVTVMLNVVKHLAQLPEYYRLDSRPLTSVEILRFTQDDRSASVMLNVVKHLAQLPEYYWQEMRPPTPVEILRIRSG